MQFQYTKKMIKTFQKVITFSKIFERVIYNSPFNLFTTNELFTSSQSGFLPGHSCIAQLLSVIHEIQTGFDVRGVFFNI